MPGMRKMTLMPPIPLEIEMSCSLSKAAGLVVGDGARLGVRVGGVVALGARLGVRVGGTVALGAKVAVALGRGEGLSVGRAVGTGVEAGVQAASTISPRASKTMDVQDVRRTGKNLGDTIFVFHDFVLFFAADAIVFNIAWAVIQAIV